MTSDAVCTRPRKRRRDSSIACTPRLTPQTSSAAHWRARPGSRTQILRVRLEENERRRSGEASLHGRTDHLPEESGGRERRGAAPEIHRVRPERRRPEFQLPQQSLPVTLEAPRTGPAERGHREIAVRTDARTEGNVDIEPRRHDFRGFGGVFGRPGRRFRTFGHAAELDFRTATKAAWGICTFPTCFMRFFPSFWRSRSFRFRVTSPP